MRIRVFIFSTHIKLNFFDVTLAITLDSHDYHMLLALSRFLPLVLAFLAVQTFRVADTLWSMPRRDCSFHGKRISFYNICRIT